MRNFRGVTYIHKSVKNRGGGIDPGRVVFVLVDVKPFFHNKNICFYNKRAIFAQKSSQDVPQAGLYSHSIAAIYARAYTAITHPTPHHHRHNKRYNVIIYKQYIKEWHNILFVYKALYYIKPPVYCAPF